MTVHRTAGAMHRLCAIASMLLPMISVASCGASPEPRAEIERDAPAPTASPASPTASSPARDDAVGASTSQILSIEADIVTYPDVEGLAEAAELIVVARPADGARVLRLAPDRFDANDRRSQLGAVYEQTAEVSRTLKGAGVGTITLSLTGINTSDPTVAQALAEGEIQIPPYGLGPLPAREMVLFLRRGGVVGVPPDTIDYSHLWTVVGVYQGALPIVGGRLEQMTGPDLSVSDVDVAGDAPVDERLLVTNLDGLTVDAIAALAGA